MAYDKLGFGNHVTRMPFISTIVCNLFVSLLYWPLFLFQEAVFQTVDFQWMFHYFGSQSTMQGEGWSIMMSNGSSRVWSSVATGLHRPGYSANLCWATGPLTAGWNLPIHIRKHQPYHMYIWHDTLYLISSESSRRQLTAWDFKFNWSF